ncbi:succinate dehydrogenase assembly factor 2 [Pseudooceanicola sp. LIPI14-2-Ac024]|uniref:succinate dehydrogenase assembly factor 2 n=1 Tax=Pseudooceanicola sp. LIPI14-2-Ac024 TaxID=3344875 RepID=UPI0035D00DA3
MTETPEIRLKRLQMRSMRRGIKEMDILLSRFAETELAGMTPEALDLYEAMLEENDQDLLVWVTGQQPAPQVYAALLGRIRDLGAVR